MSSINEIVKYSSKVVLDSTALLIKSREFAIYAAQLVKASVRHNKRFCMTETACKNLYKLVGDDCNYITREEASNACRLIEQLKGLGCLEVIPVGENGKGKHLETLDLINQSSSVVIFCRDRLLAETIEDRAEIYHVDRHGHAVPWTDFIQRQAA